MAGLTRDGFTPLTETEIVSRISAKLDAFSSGIDLSPEAPDGFLVETISYELGLAWAELGLVYNSYNPNNAIGSGLRNLGNITGLAYGAATRSQANIALVGTAGTVVAAGSVVTDSAGNEFTTSFLATIPSSVQVIATISGPISVVAGSINTIKSPITGWDSVLQSTDGRSGEAAQTDNAFRNLRNKTVLRNYAEVPNVIRGRLMEDLGIEQVEVINNDSPSLTLPDGTPPQTVHVIVGEIAAHITDENIAKVVLSTKGLGCPTYGNTATVVDDDQGNPHTIYFSKATVQSIFMDIEILFLDPDYAGLETNIRKDLVDHINSLNTGEDVIWSRLFGLITPYAKAQVNKLELSTDGITYAASNIVVDGASYTYAESGNIGISVVN